MARTTPPLLSRLGRILEGFGANLKLARLRRKYSAETVAQRAGITRRTLLKVERGDSAVALGSLCARDASAPFGGDLARVVVDDILGRKLQDAGIAIKRTPRKGPLLSLPKIVRLMNRKERIDD